MTTVRGEIVLEGSVDGVDWREYSWRYKPGDLDTTPVFVQPGHMPRLDWRVWFLPLALMRGRPVDPWFDRFVERLLEGSPAVLGLMASDPFANGPLPARIRAHLCVCARRVTMRLGAFLLKVWLSAQAPVWGIPNQV